jgi:hypothetical protein
MTKTITVKIPTKPTPLITLLWDDGTEVAIPVLSKVRGIRREGVRPYGFWYEPNQPNYGISREEFMIWLHEEFKHIFNEDASIFNTHLALVNYV